MRKLLAFLLLLALPARSGVELLSYDEFKTLAAELSHKVSLFRDAWALDPKAELYGGTSRDFLYWVKGQFRNVGDREGALAKMESLRALPLIDARDFIIGDSDVAIVTRVNLCMSPEAYGMRKLDKVDPARFDATTQMGKDELRQGFIPVEKIRLAKNGFVPWAGVGDGIAEIYSGRLTLHPPDPKELADTHYGRQKLNHDILLGLRYVRVLAMNYFRENGHGYPDKEMLLKIDEPSRRALEAIVKRTMSSADFATYLAQPKFAEWLNKTVQKSFRSYTNPTAALLLFREFGLDRIVGMYPEQIEPINQYLFAKNTDAAAVAAKLAHFGATPELFFLARNKEFPDGNLYHGTRTEAAFLGILRQGVLPSQNGTAGYGLYGVAADNLDFARAWAGDPDRIVSFTVRPNARIVDITHGEGQRVFNAFLRSLPYDMKPPGTYQAFTEAFGIDVLRYPYHSRAYVVKNSAALGRPQGHTRKVMTFSRFLRETQAAKTFHDGWKLLGEAEMNGFTSEEKRIALDLGTGLREDPRWNAFYELWTNDKLPHPLKASVYEVIAAVEALRAAGHKPGPERVDRVMIALDKLNELLARENEPGKFIRYVTGRSLKGDPVLEALFKDKKPDAYTELVFEKLTRVLADPSTPEANQLVGEALARRITSYSALRNTGAGLLALLRGPAAGLVIAGIFGNKTHWYSFKELVLGHSHLHVPAMAHLFSGLLWAGGLAMGILMEKDTPYDYWTIFPRKKKLAGELGRTFKDKCTEAYSGL